MEWVKCDYALTFQPKAGSQCRLCCSHPRLKQNGYTLTFQPKDGSQCRLRCSRPRLKQNGYTLTFQLKDGSQCRLLCSHPRLKQNTDTEPSLMGQKSNATGRKDEGWRLQSWAWGLDTISEKFVVATFGGAGGALNSTLFQFKLFFCWNTYGIGNRFPDTTTLPSEYLILLLFCGTVRPN